MRNAYKLTAHAALVLGLAASLAVAHDGGKQEAFLSAQRGGGFPYVEEFAFTAVADFDGDGNNDVFLACAHSPNRLFFGDGKGKFKETKSKYLPTDNGQAVDQGVTVGDVDGDGDIDILMSHGDWDPLNAKCVLWINNGQGRFTDRTAAQLPSFQARPIHLVDVDGDKDLDVIYGRSGKQNGLLLNNGSGYFSDATATHLPTDTDHTFCFAVGDVDGDGDLDIAVGNWKNGTPNAQQDRLLLNNGSGSFSYAPTANMPTDATLARGMLFFDWEGDGDKDLILANGSHYGPAKDRLYLNNGSGKFTLDTTGKLPVMSDGSRTYRTADVDGDGDLDLFTPQVKQSRLLRNNGSGSFTDVTATMLPVDQNRTRTAAFARFHKGKAIDLVVASGNQIRVLTNKNGKFSTRFDSYLPFKPTSSEGVALGDVDGDGDLDAVFVNYQVYPEMPTHNMLFINDGRGRYTDMTSTQFPADTKNSTCVVLVDVDGDKDLDAVIGNEVGGTMLYLNNGAGTFTDASTRRMPFYNSDLTYSIAAADVDGDGDADIILANAPPWWGGPNRLFLNNGSGEFTDVTSTNMPGVMGLISRGLAIGDVDGDNDLDIVVGNGFYTSGGATNAVYLNNGSGKFTIKPGGFTTKCTTLDLVLGDVDGDGDLDLYEATGINLHAEEADRLYLNDGTGKFTVAPAGRMPVLTPDYCFCCRMFDYDGDGDLDILAGKSYYYADMGAQTRLYRNNGKGYFKDVTDTMPRSTDHVNWLTVGDVDGDGDLDIMSAHYYEPQLYLNTARQLWAPKIPVKGERYEFSCSAGANGASEEDSHVLFMVALKPAKVMTSWGLLGIDLRSVVWSKWESTDDGIATVKFKGENSRALLGLKTFYVQAVIEEEENHKHKRTWRYSNTLIEQPVK